MLKRVLALLLAGAHPSSSFLVQRIVRPATHATFEARSEPLLAVEQGETTVKIKVKPPTATTSTGESSASASSTTIKVNVRPKTDVPPSPPVVADDDDSVTIKVNRPAAAPPAPAKPAAPRRSEAEELLLNATQGANCTKMLQALEAGANPNIRDPNGRTPLHFCAGVGLAPACVLLVHFGAQLDVRDKEGLTPLHMAAGYANAQSLKVLIAAGANASIPGNSQGTALEVVTALGEYQYEQVWKNRKNEKNPLKRFKKKDEKLEKLKSCMEVLEDTEKVQKETVWEDELMEVLKTLALE